MTTDKHMHIRQGYHRAKASRTCGKGARVRLNEHKRFTDDRLQISSSGQRLCGFTLRSRSRRKKAESRHRGWEG